MGFAQWLKRKLSGKKPKESSQLRRTLEAKYAIEQGMAEAEGRTQTITMPKTEIPAQQIMTPNVEHPLLTIQDRMVRLEEIYRGLNDKIMVIDGKVATKHDIEDVKGLIGDDLDKGERVLAGIDNISLDILALRAEKEDLSHTIATSSRDIETRKKRLTKVEEQIGLMECDDKILDALGSSDLSTIELAEKLGFTRQYVWERLKELSKVNKVKSVKKGRQTKYVLVN